MTFEADLKAHLAGSAALTALVGAKITPMVAARGSAAPYVTFHVAVGLPQNSLDGFTSNLTRYDLQLDAWALTHPVMLSVADALLQRLKTAATTIKFVIHAYPSFDDFELETELYRRSIAVSCWHKPA
jgi:hypothetical protein